MSKPSISILMSVYREPAEAVAVAVKSVFAQTYKNYELLIALDDPQNMEAKAYLEQLATEHKNVRVFYNETNIGLGASLNRLAAEARGEFCARMDTEDTIDPEKLAKQISHFEDCSTTDILFTQWREIYDDGRTVERTPRAAEVQYIEKYFFTKSILLHASMMIKTEILKTHPYPAIERPEDFGLYLTLMRRGYNFDLLEEVLYTYQIDTEKTFKKVQTYSKNLLLLLFKNIRYFYRNGYFWLYLIRASGEYIVSRNELIFTLTHKRAARLWKNIFR